MKKHNISFEILHSFALANCRVVNSRMKQVFTGIGLAAIVVLLFNGTTRYISPNHFIAYIVQDGKQLPIDNHIVKAKKAPFKIVIEMQDTKGVFVSASLHSSTYNQSARNVAPDKLPGFRDVAIYEVWKNPTNELIIEGKMPNFWFIESPSKHRFTSYEKVNGSYVCSRNVKSLYDIEKQSSVSLETISKPLYLTFIKFKPEAEDYRSEELMRHGFKIEWE